MASVVYSQTELLLENGCQTNVRRAQLGIHKPLCRGKKSRFACLRCTYGFPNPFLFDYKISSPQKLKPQSVVRPLTYYFRLFPSLPVHLSFAYRHLTCLILSTQPATSSRIRLAICSTTYKICTGSNDRFGLNCQLLFYNVALISAPFQRKYWLKSR